MIIAAPMNAASDRLSACEKALETAHIALVDTAVANGWTEREVAEALLRRAMDHLELLESTGRVGLRRDRTAQARHA